MAKGPIITDEVKGLIMKVYLDHPHMRAKEVQAEVNFQYMEKHPHVSPDWPGLSSVQKILQGIRSKHLDSPHDSTWSLHTLAQYDIPADALPVVLKAYGLTIVWELTKPLTIREAKWVARLYRVLTDIEELTVAARECASNERINEITQKPKLSLVDMDFKSRALKGKPGISYKYLGDGKFQMRIHDDENIVI